MKSSFYYAFAKSGIIFLTILTFAACDTDPIQLGGDFINVNPSGTILSEEYEVKTINVPLGPVQTDNFNSAVLGRYEDPVYGSKEYSFVTQAGLGFYNPDFGIGSTTEPELVRVQVNIPYFSRAVGVNGEETIYELDSVYSAPSGDFKLSVYRNNYFLNSFDPNDISRPATFFSDQKSLVESSINFSDPLFEFTEIVSADEEEVFNADGTIADRIPPALRIDERRNDDGTAAPILDFFEGLLLDPSIQDQLVSAAVFRNYFRGFYFVMDDFQNGDVLAHLDINNAFIELTINTTQVINGQSQLIPSAFRINFNGVRANFIASNTPVSTQNQIAASTVANGSERIFLSGGEGVISLIDIFGDDTNGSGLPDALDELRDNQVLINDAFIDFFVDQSSQLDGRELPERITLFDPDTTSPISDYSLSEAQSVNQINANLVHLGRLEREEEDDLSSAGVKYRIRIADYLSRLVQIDQSNLDGSETRLAIAVSQNVGSITQNEVLDPTQPVNIDNIQLGTAISHEGVVLHGNLSSDIELRPKLTVFYTPIN